MPWARSWVVEHCRACGKPNLFESTWDEGDSHDEGYAPTTERVFPVKADNRSVPGSVNRALRVKQIDPTCYALVIRRMLESICNDKDVDTHTKNKTGRVVRPDLHERLERLATRDERPPTVKDLTSSSRVS